MKRISFSSFIITRLAEGRGVGGAAGEGDEKDIERCSGLRYVLDLRILVDRPEDIMPVMYNG